MQVSLIIYKHPKVATPIYIQNIGRHADRLEILEPSTSYNPKGLCRLVMG